MIDSISTQDSEAIENKEFKLHFIRKTMHNMQPYNTVGICKLCMSSYPLWMSLCPYCQPLKYIII